ncbi:MAG: metalloregulator ArsR/SmtB family transcription factor [Gammaproteobacteria bacterium]
MRQTAVLTALSGLAQENRLKIFRALVQVGPDGMTAGKIARKLKLAASAFSFHVAHLERAALVNSTKQGRQIIYSANYKTMNGLVVYLRKNCCAGSKCRTTSRS